MCPVIGPLLRFRKYAKLESGHTPSRSRPEYWEACTVPWFTLADVWQIRDARQKHVFETKEKISELGLANSSARLLPAGTVMLSRTASVGYSAIMGKDMATTQDFANWVCGQSLRPEYLLYSLRAMTSEFERFRMGSTHNTIYMPDIAALKIAIPPLPEQQAIATFLDRETGKIDALVEEQRRLIALLREKRQAVISHAVTKGLDPSAPMKPSGIDWLGDIPAHWIATRLRFLAQELQTGPFGSQLHAQDYVTDGVPLINPSNIQAGQLIADPNNTVDESTFVRLGHHHIVAGDIIVARRGELGRCAVASLSNQGWICGTGSLQITARSVESSP